MLSLNFYNYQGEKEGRYYYSHFPRGKLRLEEVKCRHQGHAVHWGRARAMAHHLISHQCPLHPLMGGSGVGEPLAFLLLQSSKGEADGEETVVYTRFILRGNL